MRRELDRYLFTGGDRQFLFDLGKMSMFRHAVGPHALIALGEQIIRFNFATRAGDATQTRHKNIFGPDKLLAKKRQHRKQNTRWVTTGTGNQFRVANLISINFRQTVNRLA